MNYLKIIKYITYVTFRFCRFLSATGVNRGVVGLKTA